MALQDILKKIQAEADAQIAEIKQQLEADKKAATKAAEASRKNELKVLSQKTDDALAGVDQKIDTMARRENRQALLSARRSLLDQAMENFYQALVGADDSVKKSIFDSQAKSLNAKGATIVAANSDKALVEKCFADATVTGSDEIKGGFMVQSGGMEIDNTFHNLVFSEYRESLEMYFTDQLKLV